MRSWTTRRLCSLEKRRGWPTEGMCLVVASTMMNAWWSAEWIPITPRRNPSNIQKRILHGPIPSWKQRIVCTTSNSSPLFLFSHVFPWIDCRRNNIVSDSFYTPFHFHFTTPKSKYVPNPFSYVCVRHTFVYSYLMGIVNSRIEDKKSFSIVMPGTEDLSTGSV